VRHNSSALKTRCVASTAATGKLPDPGCLTVHFWPLIRRQKGQRHAETALKRNAPNTPCWTGTISRSRA
jgi:hypothetical protein